ncbi:helix-hairpin-helix domain-containing protein [Reyranella soli]
MSRVRHKPSSFEEYWLASKAWERKGLPLGTARALANAGFLKVDDLRSANALELASIPRVGRKSLAILHKLADRTKARP